jgi:hypothetical protein
MQDIDTDRGTTLAVSAVWIDARAKIVGADTATPAHRMEG